MNAATPDTTPRDNAVLFMTHQWSGAIGARYARLFREVTASYQGDMQNPCADLTRQATLRWRPEITVDEFLHRGTGPLLFHPVKRDWGFDGDKVVQW